MLGPWWKQTANNNKKKKKTAPNQNKQKAATKQKTTIWRKKKKKNVSTNRYFCHIPVDLHCFIARKIAAAVKSLFYSWKSWIPCFMSLISEDRWQGGDCMKLPCLFWVQISGSESYTQTDTANKCTVWAYDDNNYS